MLKSHLSKEANKKSVMNERNVLSQCNHPNIVKLYKAFRDDEYFCMLPSAESFVSDLIPRLRAEFSAKWRAAGPSEKGIIPTVPAFL
jgi:serine/threonine protein kinase